MSQCLHLVGDQEYGTTVMFEMLQYLGKRLFALMVQV